MKFKKKCFLCSFFFEFTVLLFTVTHLEEINSACEIQHEIIIPNTYQFFSSRYSTTFVVYLFSKEKNENE